MRDIETTLLHGGIDGDGRTGAVNVPIYQTSTYKQIRLGEHTGYEYSRTGNPTREALEKLIAELEGGARGFAFASGMAAITAILTLFKTGDKVLISNNVYGGTFRVLDKIFSNFGLEYEFVDTTGSGIDGSIKDDIENKLTAPVKALLIESPANPLMTVTDIAAAADIAKRHGVLTIVDNTFMSPYLQRPIELGADIVLHSATKYLGGHSDLIAGLAVTADEVLGEKLHFIQNATGGILQPFDSFLLIRGIKTLGVRLDRHQENALYAAEWLQKHPGVARVYYPGLPGDAGYEIQKRQANGPGGMLSFELNGGWDHEAFINGLSLVTLAESLGGVESLICQPSSMTHASIPEDIRKKIHITEKLIRFSVGIENKHDIVADLRQALDGARRAS
ncbi:MAG: PLP-dependent aspartate aminotransferase family protein [Synergistaceae bacterium]|jgi:cystathionine beta-lyase|nr:PLP-dependent aspartate aminotransferase family protein [Synergistaceae bacterium]